MKANKKKRIRQISVPLEAKTEISTDPQGSYTGVPEDWSEEPVQDVDDL